MGILRRIFGSSNTSPPPLPSKTALKPAPKTKNTFITRGNKEIKADEVFLAWGSGDLKRMLAATNYSTNPIDRHFLLQEIVKLTYKNRNGPEMRAQCREYAALHIREFSSIRPHLEKEMDGVLPRVSTFQNLATLLTEDGSYTDAIAVCRRALDLGLDDGTKSGYEGRIARIERKKG